jgi:hypothetical protein
MQLYVCGRRKSSRIFSKTAGIENEKGTVVCLKTAVFWDVLPCGS